VEWNRKGKREKKREKLWMISENCSMPFGDFFLKVAEDS
jgi:hypothetical protein